MDSGEEGTSGVKIMTRKDIYEAAQQCNENTFTKKLEVVANSLMNSAYFDHNKLKDFKRTYSHVKSQMKIRWFKAHKKEAVFLKYNETWLNGIVEIPTKQIRRGRPSKSFVDLSTCGKRRKTKTLREQVDTETLTFATQMKLRASGQTDAAQILRDITNSPTRATVYKKAYSRSTESKPTQVSPLKALAMFVEAGLSRRQYEIVRSTQKKLFPCYTILQRAKQDCYPDRTAFTITDTCAEVRLQSVLNHTSERLALYLEEILETLSVEDKRNLQIIYKWGCDGSQQTSYKQKFANDADSDANIFQSSFVPLQLATTSSNKKILWENPTPSSPRYCRPIRIRFVHESTDITNEEIAYIQEQIDALQPTIIKTKKLELYVNHVMLFTMVDGKICNAATQTLSTMRCYICGDTSKTFNDLSREREEVGDTLKFGLSILHARIRFFETLLHVSYKLPIKKWQLRQQYDKDAVKERKRSTQERFKKELGLLVDIPKPGFGNTNDGNTSRRFFANPEKSAEITGLDVRLIHRFKVVLEVIASGHRINVEKFKEYCYETAKLYVELYSWHPMSPNVHKVLIHGPIIVAKALLPIGQLSEEAAEARNKHFRLFRLNFSRKNSRINCNMDIINRLLLTSDPLVTSIRPTPRKQSKPFLKETLGMLLPSRHPSEGGNSSSSGSGSSGSSSSSSSSDEDLELSDEESWLTSSD